PNQFYPSTKYYGAGLSIRLEKQVGGSFNDIPGTDILVADLSDVKDTAGNVIAWAHDAFGQRQNKILLDPMLGRVLFPAESESMFATFCYAFSADIGGGEYDRSRSFDISAGTVIEVANTEPTDTKKRP